MCTVDEVTASSSATSASDQSKPWTNMTTTRCCSVNRSNAVARPGSISGISVLDGTGKKAWGRLPRRAAVCPTRYRCRRFRLTAARSVMFVSAKSSTLLSEVLALPTDERAEIVAELLASLDDAGNSEDTAELDRIWAAEMSRRSQQIASGAATTETWDDVLRRVADDRRTR